jgi:hypothetical protein
MAVEPAWLDRLADHVEVLAPGTVRTEMAALGHRLVARYGGPTTATGAT